MIVVGRTGGERLLRSKSKDVLGVACRMSPMTAQAANLDGRLSLPGRLEKLIPPNCLPDSGQSPRAAVCRKYASDDNKADVAL